MFGQKNSQVFYSFFLEVQKYVLLFTKINYPIKNLKNNHNILTIINLIINIIYITNKINTK
jgi:hypothetical protein